MTPQEVLRWLDAHVCGDPWEEVSWSDARVESLDGGLLNHVWRVRAGAQSVVVKFSPEHIATAPQVPLSASRSVFEARALGLFGGVAPRAVENFRSLCVCDKGNGKLSDKPLCYKGTEFHRISK